MSHNPLDEGLESFDFSVLPRPLRESLADKGIENPTPIQQQAIPAVLEGRDLLGLSQTGSGKTLAFALPIALRLWEGERTSSPRALVVAPTRELAQQVEKVFRDTLGWLRLRCLTVMGGTGYRQQIEGLKRGVDVLVATPGRLLDLIRKNLCDVSAVEYYVLDEVDQMLDIGFAEELSELRKLLPGDRQTLFFSATLHKALERVALEWLNDPFKVNIAPNRSSPKTITHKYLVLRDGMEIKALSVLLQFHNPASALIFCETRQECRDVAAAMEARGWNAAPLNSDLSQEAREATLRRFKRGRVRFLVATNVAARGIDVQDLPLVINFKMPFDPESYTHRTGRTGRAGNLGEAWTFVSPRFHQKFWRMMKLLSLKPRELEMPERSDLMRLMAERELTSFGSAAEDNLESETQALLESLISTYSRQEIFLLLRGALQRSVEKAILVNPEELVVREEDLFRRHDRRHHKHRRGPYPGKKGGHGRKHGQNKKHHAPRRKKKAGPHKSSGPNSRPGKPSRPNRAKK
jgi:superfamily II DNA/RNA helicase